ncbi:synaptotagmin-16 isoform X2 [Syngnathoides biaculeatus]|uniref:synaptotagmin-16 isoform X2 n=1 Tax=Syngnathoides biaculeatus TaxID=300417 RepID=UPI002ADE209C|nr:synaptotagmin-16 isoform X2 [Syngnathoides biaculeatus]
MTYARRPRPPQPWHHAPASREPETDATAGTQRKTTGRMKKDLSEEEEEEEEEDEDTSEEMSAAPNSTAPSLEVEITAEAAGFLSAVGVFIAALALLFLFVNKMLCFSKVGGAPCLERQRLSGARRSPGIRRGLVEGSGVDGGGGGGVQSSSDSDNHLTERFEISASSFGGAEQAHSGEESSTREEADGQRNPLDKAQGAPQQQSSLAATEESAAPSAAKPPTTEDNSEDPEAGCRKTADAWNQNPNQGPRTTNAAGSSPRRPVSKCCDLLVSLEYRGAAQELLVTVASARDLPDRRRGGADAWRVHVVLLPAKKQRRKTVLRRPAGAEGAAALDFNQTFALTPVEASSLPAAALRFRVYALEGMVSRRRMMGEKVLPLTGVDPAGGTADFRLVLGPRHDVEGADSEPGPAASPTQSAAPELLMGLSYTSATGRMSVEVVKGSRFGNWAAGGAPDTFARLTLLNSAGVEMSRCKTSVRRSQPNPVYKETFAFQVALFQLSDVTLVASVYGRRGLKRKAMIGWAALGRDGSGEEERLHWRDMKDAGGAQVRRWHVLLDA